MLSKQNKTKQLKYNFQLNKSFGDNVLFINPNDIEKCVISLNMIFEYIRYCYFDDYIIYNSEKMSKYCRLLLRFEKCNQSVLVKECQNLTKRIIKEAMNAPCSLKSIDLCFALKESNYDMICVLCEELMTLSLGTKVRALNM